MEEKHHRKGFTLTEMIISVTIMLGLVGVGSASFINFNEQQTVEHAAKTLKNNLRLAQQNALTGVKTDNNSLCNANQNLTGWCVSPDHAATSTVQNYLIYGVCESVDSATGVKTQSTFPGSPIEIQLPAGVNVEMKAYNSSTSTWESGTERARFNALGDGVMLSKPEYNQISYCLSGTFPSLSNRVYRIRLLTSSEIIDDGFITNCQIAP